MSAIDFSDFDRSINDLYDSLEALKGNPEEASKKIAAFLHDNQKFLEAHKKNEHVQKQLGSLAGRVQKDFPDSRIAQRWSEYVQLILKSPIKVLEPEEFIAQIKALKKSVSTAKGERMSPDLSEQVKAFVENPRTRDFLRAHQINPSIGRALLELGVIAKKFPNDPQALRFAENLIELAKDMQLPDELIRESLKFLHPHFHPGLPEEWNSFSLDAKIEWINLHEGNLDELGFKAFDERFLRFLQEHGSKLRFFRMSPFFNMSGITNESLNQMLQFCPNLQALHLKLPTNKDFQISGLSRKLAVLDLSGNVTQLPSLPKTLISFRLSNSQIGQLPSFPEGIKRVDLENLRRLVTLPSFPKNTEIVHLEFLDLEELPPFSESTKFIRLKKLENIKKLPPLPPGLVGLSLHHLKNLKKLPDLQEGLEFLRLDLPYSLEELFNIPTSLKFLDVKIPSSSYDLFSFLRLLPKSCEQNFNEVFTREIQFLSLYGFWSDISG